MCVDSYLNLTISLPTFLNFFTISPNIPQFPSFLQFPTIFYNLPQFTKIFHIPKFSLISYNLPQFTTFLTISHIFPQFPTISHSISQFPTISNNITQYLTISHNFVIDIYLFVHSNGWLCWPPQWKGWGQKFKYSTKPPTSSLHLLYKPYK